MTRLRESFRARFPPPPEGAEGSAFRLYPYELLAIGMVVLAFAFLRLNGLDYGWNTIEYTFPPLFKALKRLLVLGIGLRLVEGLLTRTLRSYVGAIVRWRWIFDWARVWLGVMLFIYTYIWLKISVPLVRTALYDQELWKLDRILHFGLSPSVFAIELAAGTPIARAVDWWYGFWVASMAFITAYFVAMADGRRRRNFAFGIIFLWTVGAWGYVAFPALGPCYASRDVLDPIRAEIPQAIAMQDALWSQYLQMIKARTGLLRSFRPEFGVAAMPSLHVAAHAFFFFWCRRHQRWLQTPFAIATFLTFFGSVVTAWHYAVDGYAGILLAWLAVVAADRFEPVKAPAANGAEATSPAPEASRPAPAESASG